MENWDHRLGRKCDTQSGRGVGVVVGNVRNRDKSSYALRQTVMAGLWSGYVEMMITVLTKNWSVDGEGQVELRATLALALDFNSWQTLTRFGLSHDRAATLVAQMVSAQNR